MFTGIIEEMGTIETIKPVSFQAVQLVIKAGTIMEDVKQGDSIAINGICLTVTHFSDDRFQVEVMPETIKSTSLNDLTAGANVNLERSMPANGRFGGHFVSGHVDAAGTITEKQTEENATYYTITIPDELAVYFLEKGSVAVDGVSLTIFAHTESSFTVALIPHTAAETVLGAKDVADTVNIECDMLAKYVAQMLTKTGNITTRF